MNTKLPCYTLPPTGTTVALETYPFYHFNSDRNQDKVSQAYETSVGKKRVHTKQTTLSFVVRNEQRLKSRQ